jgi:FkbH-like protein
MEYDGKKHIIESMTYADLMRKRLGIKKQLLAQPDLVPVKVAILGGSTTVEVKNMLEVFLLAHGIEPSFFESGYGRFREEILFDNPDLLRFKPDVVFIHTTWRNISAFPDLTENEEAVAVRVRREMDRFTVLWEKIRSRFDALIIQNNFDLPRLRPLGNLEASEAYGRINFVMRLNAEFAAYARANSRFLINDILFQCAEEGLDAWHGSTYWYNFHMAVSPSATVTLARNVAGIVKSAYGKSKKCLVLDLDNTLWGGVIGDDGMQGIVLGRDHALGEAFLDFQKYVKELGRRGVILAVCSKNNDDVAREGFSHPDSVLKVDDFSAFKANWNPKPGNIREIAAELNIGLDSIVFLDDNPAERALVSAQLPEVATPEIDADVTRFAQILEAARYFDVVRIVQDDLSRSRYYKANLERETELNGIGDYGEFLASLAMRAEIASFAPVYLERITQLINKTNQFNLTTRRYTSAEVEALAHDPAFVTLYGRLADKFGDNGLVSVIIGREAKDELELDLWLMSCRVLNREMELAMFDALVEACQSRGIRRITGLYIPSKKNGMVADHYGKLGFSLGPQSPDGHPRWHFDVPADPQSPRTKHITRETAGFGVTTGSRAPVEPARAS